MEKVPAFQIQVVISVVKAVNILLYPASKFLCVVIWTYIFRSYLQVLVKTEMLIDLILLVWFIIILNL